MEGMASSAEDKARVRKDVQKNICTFAMLCLAIRLGKRVSGSCQVFFLIISFYSIFQRPLS